jgi:hypothetical protein
MVDFLTLTANSNVTRLDISTFPTRGKALEVPLTELRKSETEMAVDAVVNKKRAARGVAIYA